MSLIKRIKRIFRIMPEDYPTYQVRLMRRQIRLALLRKSYRPCGSDRK